jgi:hypothetical protein
VSPRTPRLVKSALALVLLTGLPVAVAAQAQASASTTATVHGVPSADDKGYQGDDDNGDHGGRKENNGGKKDDNGGGKKDDDDGGKKDDNGGGKKDDDGGGKKDDDDGGKKDDDDGGKKDDDDGGKKDDDEKVNANCSLEVPANPFSAAGLATPYRLSATDRDKGACREDNPKQSAFVEATILDPATGKLAVYHPLVIDRRHGPAAPPVVPKLPAGAVVGIWFGFQGDTLTLRGDTANCVNGLRKSQFGQFAHCGGDAFFAAAKKAIRQGRLKVPALGTGRDRLPCPTTRDFSVVDQDQSDNVVTRYLALRNGRIAQDTGEVLRGATVLTNASDNGLLDYSILPALGCRPFTAPDLTAHGRPTSSLALDELLAAAHQPTPVALVPETDPMVQVDGKRSTEKTNLYRAGVNMPPIDEATEDPRDYCRNLSQVGRDRLELDRQFTSAMPTPQPGMGNNLYDFLKMRLKTSLKMLKCKNRGDRERDK